RRKQSPSSLTRSRRTAIVVESMRDPSGLALRHGGAALLRPPDPMRHYGLLQALPSRSTPPGCRRLPPVCISATLGRGCNSLHYRSFPEQRQRTLLAFGTEAMANVDPDQGGPVPVKPAGFSVDAVIPPADHERWFPPEPTATSAAPAANPTTASSPIPAKPAQNPGVSTSRPIPARVIPARPMSVQGDAGAVLS